MLNNMAFDEIENIEQMAKNVPLGDLYFTDRGFSVRGFFTDQ
jgi:hypothetical protein